MTRFSLPLIWILACLGLNAQSLDKSLEFGILAGTAFYQGDLSAKGTIEDEIANMRPSFGLFTRYNTGSFWSFRATLTYARIGGDDSYGQNADRDLNFRTNLFEFNVLVEFIPLVIGKPHETPLILPYLTAGAGGFLMNPETEYRDEFIKLQPLGTEAQGLPAYKDPYSLSQVCAPMGGGVRVIVNDTWTVGVEFIGRFLITDYLDDVGDTRIHYGELIAGNGVLAATLSNREVDPNTTDSFDFEYQRGGSAWDWWHTFSISASIRLWKSTDKSKFPNSPGCPVNF